MKDFFVWKSIVTGIISSLIASGILFTITHVWPWNYSLPLWLWLIVTFFFVMVVLSVMFLIRHLRLRNALSEFKESRFGDSYEYTWEYKKSRSYYSVFGYEPYKIQLKRPLNELNNEHTITIGHEVTEDTIKRIVQLTLYAMIDESAKSIIMPTIEYLHFIETKNSNRF